VGRGPPRGGQPRHHEPPLGAAGPAAQKKSLIATERDDAARAAWRAAIAAVPPETLVFLDETSTPTAMVRARARAPRGQRAVGCLPRNHGPNVTCLAAFTPAGIVAPLVLAGALDGPAFAQWAAECLVAVLRPGQTVVLDNLSVHKSAAARAAVEGAGCRLHFPPPYSPTST